MSDLDAFNPGVPVRLRSNPARRGHTTNKTKTAGTRTYVQVEFGPNERDYINVADLESANIEVKDIADWLLDLRFGRIGDLGRVLTFKKISSRLSNVFYAMQASRTDFYSYQFKPVYKYIESTRGRILIADEVGLGKTIESGLIWLEAKARTAASRLLIVCPSMLREKWKRELRFRFNVDAEIYDSKGFLSLLKDFEQGGDNFQCAAVCSIQGLRGKATAEALADFENTSHRFDLVVIDEAHHFRNVETRTHQLGRRLSDLTESLVLLTATPIQLGSKDLFRLLSLLEPDEFQDQRVFEERLQANEPIVKAQNALIHANPDIPEARTALEHLMQSPWFARNPLAKLILSKVETLDAKDLEGVVDASRILENLNLLSSHVSRTRKREVQEWRVLRESIVLEVEFSNIEAEFYHAVTRAVREQVERLGYDNFATFALMMPQRQMASCIPAMVEHYRANAESWLLDENLMGEDVGDWSDDDGDDQRTIRVSAARELHTLIESWPSGTVDSKYDALIDGLRELFDREPDSKIIIFSYFKRTLGYLKRRLAEDGYPTAVIHGDVPMADRETEVDRFRSSPRIPILLSSEVGSEGIDLQFCRVVVNYDLPWNPMKVEQRIGRVDRLGQKTSKITIVNFSVLDTIEARILDRLYMRIGIFERSLGELEPILGGEIQKLTIDLLSRNLTPAQEDARIRQTQRAIEEKRKGECELEDRSAAFVGTSDYILERIRAARRMGRWITPEELRRFVADYFAHNFRGTRIAWDHPEIGLVSISLSSNARNSLAQFWRSRGGAPTTVLVRPSNEACVLAYTSEAAQENPKREFLTHFHPLSQWIVQTYRDRTDEFFPAAAVEVASERVPPDEYVFAVEFWTFTAVVSDIRIAYAMASLDVDGPVFDGPEVELLLQDVLAHGTEWPHASTALDGNQARVGWQRCSKALDDKRDDAFATFEIEAAATAERRKVHHESFSRRKADSLRAAIITLTSKGAPSRQIRSFQTRLDNLEQSTRLDLEKIQEGAIARLTITEVAGGVCRVKPLRTGR